MLPNWQNGYHRNPPRRRLHQIRVPTCAIAAGTAYWVDAASSPAHEKGDAIIGPRPGQPQRHRQRPQKRRENYIGGTVPISLMLMALGGLFQNDLVEWVNQHDLPPLPARVRKYARTHQRYGRDSRPSSGWSLLILPARSSTSTAIRFPAQRRLSESQLRRTAFAGSLIPWIDVDLGNGQSKEEWKGGVETNKILGRSDNPTVIDGLCVRIGSMRCHSKPLP